MSRSVENVHDDDFEDTLQRDELVFVDFYADWCGPCRAVAPVIERVAMEYAGRVRFVKLNIDANPLTARRFGIRSIPTVILFKNGRRIAGLSGYQTEHNLRVMVGSHVSAEARSVTPQGARGLVARLLRRAS